MTTTRTSRSDPRIHRALSELQDALKEQYPRATFMVSEGDDPEGVYLSPIIDIDDTEEIFDVIGDRLLAWQVDEDLPIYVFPLRPLARVLAERKLETHVPHARAHR